MAIEEKIWQYLQLHLGFDEEQMKVFRDEPRNGEIVRRGMQVRNREVVFEVIESQGCYSGHKVGDQIVFDPFGNLITGRCPERVCVHAIQAGAHALFGAGELMFHGIDPNRMRFRRFGCLDVGLQCGGWGHVVMELTVREPDNGQS